MTNWIDGTLQEIQSIKSKYNASPLKIAIISMNKTDALEEEVSVKNLKL